MKLLADLTGDVLAVQVDESRLDAAVATPFKDAMRRAVEAGGSTVVLDLQRVDFIDSSGLGALIAVLKSLQGQRALVLTGLQPNVERVMRLTRMDSVFIIAPPGEAAAAPRAGVA